MSSPSVINGVVTFEDEAHIEAFIESRISIDDDAISADLDFLSFREAAEQHFEEIEALPDDADFIAALNPAFVYIDGAEKELRPKIPLGVVAQLINSNGQIVVGDTEYKFDGPNVSFTRYSDADRTTQIAEGIATARFTLLSEKLSEGPEGVAARGRGEGCTKTSGSRKYRLKGEVQFNDFLFYSEVRAVTKHQRKRFGTWHRRKTGFVEVDAGSSKVCPGEDSDQGSNEDDCGDYETSASSCDCFLTKECVDEIYYYRADHDTEWNYGTNTSCRNEERL